ncbi:Lrp/AsnC ligand binding domain-containing protein [Haloferax larsenii]|uniref:Lrp/AsnC ligand binding domain-containing protein n=2 Tax=Haloferax TaxID=2251 RepID=A0ABY5R9V0_HALLR|nr:MULTISPECIES: Lrp/AsnC ligand binding domain-containing protein [Haloferax]ELZ84198.1 AsnC family transcriptional regulator [Haloferax larsenii JCM 13917]ELZ85506.1 AsnC family transcriptional regulator [Haloferax elongans ATCC BAA-1513]UVE49109.1 Lrp/AsnC ligand binding domain-containing protein [Haloferax larsenii]
MVEAYVTIQTGAGTARDVVEQLRTLDNVVKASIVAGEFDIVAEVEADSERDLLGLISDDIQQFEGVGRTSTCIVLG